MIARGLEGMEASAIHSPGSGAWAGAQLPLIPKECESRPQRRDLWPLGRS